MDEHKTDDIEEFFDPNQENDEENNEGKNKDVDRGDEVFSSSSKDTVYVSCDEEKDESERVDCSATTEEGKQETVVTVECDDVTNTVVEDDDAINTEEDDSTQKRTEETRESDISYDLEVQYNQPRESCWTIAKQNLLDCLCCCCTPSSCGACNTRIREQQASDFVSVSQCCVTRPPGGKVRIVTVPVKTIITPYMASLGIISLEAYMELEAQKKARESVTATHATKKAEKEAEFMQIIEDITPKRVEVVEDNNTNENAGANGVTPKRAGRMKRIRRFLRRVFCCSGNWEV